MKSTEYEDNRVYELLRYAEAILNNKSTTDTKRIAWFNVHCRCLAHATLNSVRKSIQDLCESSVVLESTKKVYHAILTSAIMNPFDNSRFQFPSDIVQMIEAEREAMKRLTFRPNYLTTRSTKSGSIALYEVYRATLRVDATTGKRYMGESSKILYTVTEYEQAEAICDALVSIAYATFTATREIHGRKYNVQEKSELVHTKNVK